jgi:hypothetical protein
LSVDKIAGLKFLRLQFDGERLAFIEDVVVLREPELDRGHVVGGGNESNRSRVARARLDLLSVGNGEVRCRQAEVDEIVGGGEGSNLTGGWGFLTGLCEAIGDDSRVER